MADPGWGIWGKCPPPPPPPHSPCGGAIFLIITLNFMPGKISLLNSRNKHILLAFITNSPATKVNQSQTNYEMRHPAPLCVLSASKNNYRVAVV